MFIRSRTHDQKISYSLFFHLLCQLFCQFVMSKFCLFVVHKAILHCLEYQRFFVFQRMLFHLLYSAALWWTCRIFIIIPAKIVLAENPVFRHKYKLIGTYDRCVGKTKSFCFFNKIHFFLSCVFLL